MRAIDGAGRVEFDRLLAEVLSGLAIGLSSTQEDALYRHYTLLAQWNQQMNLTAITKPEEVVFRHFGESLAVAKLIGRDAGGVVDIGSGAGFPGGPIAVYCSDRMVTLVEASTKKAVFLKEIARSIPNLSVRAERAEQFEGRVEWAAMRGVALKDVEADVRRVADRMALIVSGEKLKDAKLAAFTNAEQYTIPWDHRTVILIANLRST